MAVRENCTEVVQILLDNKADVNHMNPHGGTPLFEAVDKGYFHVSVTLNHLETKRFRFGSYWQLSLLDGSWVLSTCSQVFSAALQFFAQQLHMHHVI